MLILSGLLSIGFVTVDFIRFRSHRIQSIFLRVFEPLLKNDEKKNNLTGATHLFISATIVIIIFNRDVAIAALFIMSIADAGAAIAGTFYGYHPLFNKTWEGSLIFFILTCIIIMFTKAGLIGTVVTSLITTTIEALPVPINDNYSVAFASAVMLTIILAG
jgi:dolichol kinase